MNRFALCSLLAAALVGAAHASYELMLVADSGTNSIHRFDASSGAYLGSFGAGRFSALTSIAVNASTGMCYVSDFNRGTISEFDYSNGLLMNEFLVYGTSGAPRNVAVLPTGDLLVAGQSGLVRLSTYGSLVRTYATGAYAGCGYSPDGYAYGVDASSTLRRYNASSGALSGVTTLPSISISFYWQMAFSGPVGYLADPDHQGVRSLTSANPPVSANLYLTPTVDKPRALAFGHGPTLYVAGVNAANSAQGIVQTYSTVSGSMYQTVSFGQSQLKNPMSIAVVVAPEPSSIAALGLGALLILRRKRK